MVPTTSVSPALANLTSWGQVRAGRLPLRLVRLFVGLTLFGAAGACFVRAGVGLEPWGVFHYGLALHTGLSLGTLVILVGACVLLLWIPLRQWPGLGTVANVLWLGIAMDLTLAVLPEFEGLPARTGLFAVALVANGLGGALYIGSQLGAGPRDGLMTGLHLRTGVSLRLIRTGLEAAVLLAGWLLGGPVGVGTVAYALLIGPLTQFFMRWTVVALPVRPAVPMPA